MIRFIVLSQNAIRVVLCTYSFIILNIKINFLILNKFAIAINLNTNEIISFFFFALKYCLGLAFTFFKKSIYHRLIRIICMTYTILRTNTTI